MCGTLTLIRILMFVFIFLFFLTGVVNIVLGTLIYTRHYTIFIDNLNVVPIMMIIIGCIIVIVAIVGFQGVVAKKAKLLKIFGVVLFIIFVIEIAGAIFCYVQRNKLEDFRDMVEKNMKVTVKRYDYTDKIVWNDLQQNLGCCGIRDAGSWKVKWNSLPPACCKGMPDKCPEEKAYKKGCLPVLFQKLEDSSLILGGVGIGMAVIELMTCIIACTMSHVQFAPAP